MSKHQNSFILFAMLIIFITVFTTRTVQAAEQTVWSGTDAAEIKIEWADSSDYFSFSKTWNPDTHRYENDRISNTKTIKVSCKGALTVPVLVILDFRSEDNCDLKPVFVQPEGVQSYSISENQLSFSIDKAGDYDIFLWLTGEGVDALGTEGKSVGQIFASAESEQPITQQMNVLTMEEPEEEIIDEPETESTNEEVSEQ